MQPAQWMHPFDTVCIRAEADVRVGGRFRIVMRKPDGEEHDVSGVYREVVPDEKLAFTWTWRGTSARESRVTIVPRADGAATELTLVYERFFDEAARDAHEGGRSSALDRLAGQFG